MLQALALFFLFFPMGAGDLREKRRAGTSAWPKKPMQPNGYIAVRPTAHRASKRARIKSGVFSGRGQAGTESERSRRVHSQVVTGSRPDERQKHLHQKLSPTRAAANAGGAKERRGELGWPEQSAQRSSNVRPRTRHYHTCHGAGVRHRAGPTHFPSKCARPAKPAPTSTKDAQNTSTIFHCFLPRT